MSLRIFIWLATVSVGLGVAANARAELLMELSLENPAQCKRLCVANSSCTQYRFRRRSCVLYDGKGCDDCRALSAQELRERGAQVGRREHRGGMLDDWDSDPNLGGRGVCGYVRRTAAGEYDRTDPNYCACVGAGDPVCGDD